MCARKLLVMHLIAERPISDIFYIIAQIQNIMMYLNVIEHL